MKKIKTLLPLLIGMFMLIGGLTFFSMQSANATSDTNCVYDDIEKDCYDTSQFNCGCIVVTPGEDG